MSGKKQLDSDKKIVVDVAEEGEIVAESRRRFIKAAGKLAIYTPPAMMVLMNPSVEAFAKSAGGEEGGRERVRPKRRKRDKKKDKRGGGNG